MLACQGPVFDVRFTLQRLRTNVEYERTLDNNNSSDPLALTFVKVPAKDMIRMSEPDHWFGASIEVPVIALGM